MGEANGIRSMADTMVMMMNGVYLQQQEVVLDISVESLVVNLVVVEVLGRKSPEMIYQLFSSFYYWHNYFKLASCYPQLRLRIILQIMNLGFVVYLD